MLACPGRFPLGRERILTSRKRWFADAVVRCSAVHARIEMQMLFMSRVRAGSEDRREVTAGCRSQSAEEIALLRRIGILLFDADAPFVGQDK
jgi:hypothetical protein